MNGANPVPAPMNITGFDGSSGNVKASFARFVVTWIGVFSASEARNVLATPSWIRPVLLEVAVKTPAVIDALCGPATPNGEELIE